MSGFMTSNTQYLIRSDIWSTRLKEIFLADLQAMKYVDMLTDFPDGNTLHIPSIGQAEIFDYEEGQAIRYSAFDTGEFKFQITDYKASATYITNKMKQDSFYTDRLVAQFVPKQSRAIAEAMEAAILAIGPSNQTPNNLNTINNGNHRFVASGTGGRMTPQDFAAAKYALQKANVPMTNLVAIVDPSVEYTLSTLANLVNLSYNPQWEGIVRDGASTGLKFNFNIFGFDVYTSQFLPQNLNETINSLTTTSGVGNLFFSTTGDALPFVGAVRQAPNVDSRYNQDFQREEYVTTARYGFGFYRPESLVTVLTNTAVIP
jgi:hypothetical protein